MNDLKSRHLDTYFEIGASMIRDKTLRNQEKKDLLKIFEDTSLLNISNSKTQQQNKHDLDKVRVLIIYLLYVSDIQ